jgi:hypothetical protein
LATRFAVSILGALAVVGLSSSRALAESEHNHTTTTTVADRKTTTGPLVATVREVTERFKNVATAENEDYHLLFGCVSGSESGAMGMHYVNLGLVMDGELDVTRPEIVIYEPTAGGGLNLIGADYLVLADAWNEKHSSPPEIMGQLLHLFEAPNRFGLPAFYTLHVWAWKDSPTGSFVNWHSNVSCDAFAGQTN